MITAAKLATMLVLLVIPSSTSPRATELDTSTIELVLKREHARVRMKIRDLRRAIAERRRATWRREVLLDLPRTRTAFREQATTSLEYLRWIRSLWSQRADARWRLYASLRDPVRAIEFVFGTYAGQALAVAECESRLSIYARNGQYLGLFQMGSSERATFGHGSTALAQARAARDYFIASGRDWSPWACQP